MRSTFYTGILWLIQNGYEDSAMSELERAWDTIEAFSLLTSLISDGTGG